MDNLQKYAKLKSDIIELKNYIAEQYDVELNPHIDSVLTEINDLLLGIEQGQLYMPYKEVRMGITWSATDGVYENDKKLERMIYKIQNDIYSIKRFIVVLAKYKLFSHKKVNDINWLFPNLKCTIGQIHCISYMDEDMFEIIFPNGYRIDLGYLKNEYIITVTKNDNWNNIIEEEHIKLRSMVEGRLQNFIYKYENM